MRFSNRKSGLMIATLSSLKGMVFLTEPITRKDDHGNSISICYGRDPEGNWIEFIETTTI